MLTRIFSASLLGIGANLIEIEVVSVNGLPQFSIVGLASTEVKEAKERVYAAIKSSGYKFPQTKKIVNLSPADSPKSGTGFDLGIAYGLLIASGELKPALFASDDSSARENFTDTTLILGELSLDGTVRAVPGVLPAVAMAKEALMKRVVVPVGNLYEASLVAGIEALGVGSLRDLAEGNFTSAESASVSRIESCEVGSERSHDIDFAEIKGQDFAKRALEVAAAGGHNVCFSGPPGSGKTLLSKALASILPPLSEEEALEVAKIYSVCRLLDHRRPLNFDRPFRSVHHTASLISIIGGGNRSMPGEITLANKGVLFFDELPEFPRSVVEALRQPLEDKVITVTRANKRFTYPADFMFMASMNPCPCGYNGDGKKECKCSGVEILRYLKKISGPMLDRIDLFVNVPRVETQKLVGVSMSESSAAIRKRVAISRKIQQRRLLMHGITTNAQMSSRHIAAYCPLTESQRKFLKQMIDRHSLSARSYYRILKLARTIADLSLSDVIRDEHIMEAVRFKVQLN